MSSKLTNAAPPALTRSHVAGYYADPEELQAYRKSNDVDETLSYKITDWIPRIRDDGVVELKLSDDPMPDKLRRELETDEVDMPSIEEFLMTPGDDTALQGRSQQEAPQAHVQDVTDEKSE